MTRKTIGVLACLLLCGASAAQEPVTSDYDVPPKILKQPKPSYPDEAFQRGTEGTVCIFRKGCRSLDEKK